MSCRQILQIKKETHQTPEKFDGTRGAKAEKYGVQVELCIASNSSIFPEDRLKIIFVLSLLLFRDKQS
ncbi:uncharacterized protein VP01_2903g4 [Puccinia sorghi]|uniref:Uncharacterized protein n=1 Tax=Puccinia sorghi TaxID=27349 RepID=A0A0L6V263_9BASI|nr:uncharacterized protein VP01_2903g4 [Puccinia sorghi]